MVRVSSDGDRDILRACDLVGLTWRPEMMWAKLSNMESSLGAEMCGWDKKINISFIKRQILCRWPPNSIPLTSGSDLISCASGSMSKAKNSGDKG